MARILLILEPLPVLGLANERRLLWQRVSYVRLQLCKSWLLTFASGLYSPPRLLHFLSCRVVCVVSCRVVLCCVVLCCVVSCCVVLCCAVLCCAVLRCVVLCCVMWCCVMLWHVVLCCVMSYCVVLITPYSSVMPRRHEWTLSLLNDAA